MPPKQIKPGTKRYSVLEWFARGNTCNCFEAVRELRDYVLRSTVSDLQREYGLSFAKKQETVPGHSGSKVLCTRYWLPASEIVKARGLLRAGK